MIDRLFLHHPRTVGESYREHALVAAGVGGQMIAGGLACLVHALVPSAFVTTGSTTIRRLHARLGARRPHAPVNTNATPAASALFYEI